MKSLNVLFTLEFSTAEERCLECGGDETLSEPPSSNISNLHILCDICILTFISSLAR